MKSKNYDNSSRRNFIKKSAILGIGLSAATISASEERRENKVLKEKGVLSEKSKKLLNLFNLKYPIFQAAPGGEELAIAIANSGAMGAITLGWSSPEDAFKSVARVKAATKGNFYGNFLLHVKPDALDKALEAGCPTIQFSWGIPGKDLTSKIRASGAKFGIQVSSEQNAAKALELEPDFLICQGLEAGGHVQATSLLFDALSKILALAKDVPVLAAGGISTGHDIREALKAGAAGTILGTRFMATKESDIHEVYKASLIEAGENSTVYTICFNKGWNAMHRVLRNKTFLDWEAAGCPLEGNKPGEEDIVANHPDLGPVPRYSPMPPVKGHTGNLQEMVMYAGQGVKKVNDLPSASDLINRLWAEFENK